MAHGGDQTVCSDVFAQHHQYRIVAGDGAEDFFYAQGVERERKAVRVTGQSPDHTQITTEIDADVAANEILYVVLLSFAFLLFARQRVIVSFDAFGYLTDLKKFQVSRKRRLGHDKTFVSEVLQESLLTVYAMRFYESANRLEPQCAFSHCPTCLTD